MCKRNNMLWEDLYKKFIIKLTILKINYQRTDIYVAFFFFFLLYNIVLVLPYINMNLPQVYTCSQSWTPLSPPFPYHPSGSSQCSSPRHPVSCIEPGLAICFLYDIIHVSMPFSQIIPPHTHRVQKTILYICVSFADSHIGLSLPSF